MEAKLNVVSLERAVRVAERNLDVSRVDQRQLNQSLAGNVGRRESLTQTLTLTLTLTQTLTLTLSQTLTLPQTLTQTLSLTLILTLTLTLALTLCSWVFWCGF